MYNDDEEQKIHPCWGKVSAIDEIDWGEDSSWVHSCKGHWKAYDNGSENYNPKPAR